MYINECTFARLVLILIFDSCLCFNPSVNLQHGPDDERLEAIYDRLDELDPTTFEPRASQLLHGLGFNKAMMQ